MMEDELFQRTTMRKRIYEEILVEVFQNNKIKLRGMIDFIFFLLMTIFLFIFEGRRNICNIGKEKWHNLYKVYSECV